MKITILTLFPEMFAGPFDSSIIKRAKEKNIVEIQIINIRDFGIGKHKIVDDTPYGGGAGMIMRVDVLHKAIKAVKKGIEGEYIVLMSARGKIFTQETARFLSRFAHLIIICGHYEGVDERISKYIDAELSIGDFVTTGGEIPAMAVTDAVVRLLGGVLKEGVTEQESFSLLSDEKNISLLEYPQYTKPQVYDKQEVPPVLLSGDHKRIAQWRKTQSLIHTKKIRPDLLNKS